MTALPSLSLSDNKKYEFYFILFYCLFLKKSMTTTPLRRSYDTLINKIFRSWIENKVTKTRNFKAVSFRRDSFKIFQLCVYYARDNSIFFFFAFFVSRTWWYSLYNPEWLSHKKSNLLCRSLLYSASTEDMIILCSCIFA